MVVDDCAWRSMAVIVLLGLVVNDVVFNECDSGLWP